MRNRALVAAIAFALASSVASALAPSAGNAGFEKIKSLVGEWEARATDGSLTTLSYRVASGGSAVVETMSHAKEPDSMITVYHLDRGKLMLTHYCGAGNQPRMVAKSSDVPDKLVFSFLDATNLATPDDGHMHGLEVTFEDADHFTQVWNWKDGSKESPATFHFQRKK